MGCVHCASLLLAEKTAVLSTSMEPPILGLATRKAFVDYILAATGNSLTAPLLPCLGVLLVTSRTPEESRRIAATVSISAKILSQVMPGLARKLKAS